LQCCIEIPTVSGNLIVQRFKATITHGFRCRIPDV
jgi:hypothetical protein